MSSFTNRGRDLYNDVLKLERTLFTDQNAGKKIQQLKLRLEAIINDFDRQAKTLLEKIPQNQKGLQNVINIRSKKVKKVTVAEMNSALDQLKKLIPGAPDPAGSPSDTSELFQELRNAVIQLGTQTGEVSKKFKE